MIKEIAALNLRQCGGSRVQFRTDKTKGKNTMNLQHINLDQLKLSSLNVRKTDTKKVDDLVPSIQSLGIIQPLLVRPNCEGYEVVAGQRRFNALTTLAKDSEPEPVPCLVMDKDDDAKAIEASLSENVARLPMNEVDQYKAFAALNKQGLSAEDIAAQFGVTERLVHQRLAIANLITPILTAYKREKISAATIRLLTMASKSQQKAWFALFKDENEYAPEGYRLKEWLFGGNSISTDNALFDLDDYDGAIVSDLFGEKAYFADSEQFWKYQNTAIANAKEQYEQQGWSEVVLWEVGEYFQSYDYVDTAKEESGKVYITIANDGEVTIYEGQLSRKETKAREKAKDTDTPKATRPEITKAMQNYLDLHRHSAVRAELLNHQGMALRLAVAQMIAGSELWTVYANPQKAANGAIKKSLTNNPSELEFEQQRQQVRELLGIKKIDDDTLVYRKDDWGQSHDLHIVFAKLRELDDEKVLTILTFVMAETLPSGTAMIDALGVLMGVKVDALLAHDDTFFDLLRDKEAVNSMLKQVAGKKSADANITATAKVQKAIVREKLGQSDKAWLPNYVAFPMKAYTKRDGIAAMENWETIKKHYK